MPVGFKNGTDGNVRNALDAIRAAQVPHHFLSVARRDCQQSCRPPTGIATLFTRRQTYYDGNR
jgi:phospho-2-dehydro-3-deoxyheptonate aldolase